jgi:DnaK suppressor protein
MQIPIDFLWRADCFLPAIARFKVTPDRGGGGMRETMSFNELREQLNKRRAELLVRLERIIQELRHEGGLPADFEEQATERENDEVLAGLDDASRTEIQQIQTTLRRLDAGQYGHCKDCHKPIPAKRLKARPYSTRCLKCETRSLGGVDTDVHMSQ